MDGLISPRIWVFIRVGRYVGRNVCEWVMSEWVEWSSEWVGGRASECEWVSERASVRSSIFTLAVSEGASEWVIELVNLWVLEWEWVSKVGREQVCQWASDFGSDWSSEWMSESVSERTIEPSSERVSEWLSQFYIEQQLGQSGHLCLEFHPTLEEQILKSASTGIKKAASRYAEINKISRQ